MTHVTIKVSDDDSALTSKHLIYEVFSISKDDALLNKLIEQAKEDFGKPAEDITVKIRMDW